MKKSQLVSDQLTLFCCMENECGKTFITKFNLKRHVTSVHLKSKNFKCDYCCKTFSSKQNLDEHVFIHTGEKPYVCSTCQIAFRQISQLSLHKRDHNKPFMKLKMKKKVAKSMVSKEEMSRAFEKLLEIEQIHMTPSISYINLPSLERQDKEIELPKLSELFSIV